MGVISTHQLWQKNMLGGNCNTPQEALDLLLRSGRISQEQYNTFVKML